MRLFVVRDILSPRLIGISACYNHCSIERYKSCPNIVLFFCCTTGFVKHSNQAPRCNDDCHAPITSLHYMFSRPVLVIQYLPSLVGTGNFRNVGLAVDDKLCHNGISIPSKHSMSVLFDERFCKR